MSRPQQYWGFRINWRFPNYADYYMHQLKHNEVLRQGWGWENSHDLRKLSKADHIPREHGANVRMYNKVKKGDIILVPRIPEWEFVTITRATEDWNTGYRFEIDQDMRDYGHQFPAKYLHYFSRNNRHVRGDVRSTLKCQSRFWNMSYYAGSLQPLVDLTVDDLITDEERGNRFKRTVLGVMEPIKATIEKEINQKLSEEFAGTGWEYALVEGLRAMFPGYRVERTGGAGERKHGTDILITMPGPLEDVQYGIAIQVKDWQDEAHKIDKAAEPLRKADEGWKEDCAGMSIIEKILVLTETEAPSGWENSNNDIEILGRRNLKILLGRMALATAAIMDEQKNA